MMIKMEYAIYPDTTKEDIEFMQQYGDKSVACYLDASDVAAAEKEYSRYMKCRGSIYEKDKYKEPSLHNFVKLYFGYEVEYDLYLTPYKYVCTNKNVAERLYNLLKGMAFHDTYRQIWKSVDLVGKEIYISCGDY